MTRYEVIQEEYKGKITLGDLVLNGTLDVTIEEYNNLKEQGEIKE